MKKKQDVMRGILILIIGFVAGIVTAIIVVESGIPSNASNDGWLGFMGGLFGSLISGIVAFYILYINRKETMEIQDEHKRQIQNQMKRQTANDIAEALADYITDINIYFYNQYFNRNKTEEEKKDVNRRIAVQKYFVIQIKLKGVEEAKELLKLVEDIHKKHCFFYEEYEPWQQKQQFEKQIDDLELKAKQFFSNYTS